MKNLVLLTILGVFFNATAQKELIHEVYFETDAFEVPPTEHNRLLLFLSDIESLDLKKISIYGFTDDRGSNSYNQILSQKRANTIKTIFSNNEFDETIITNVDGKGKILVKLIKEENLNKIRGLNRKVEILVEHFDPPREIIPPENKNITTALQDKNLKAGDKIRLDNILFKTGYSVLLPESKKTLEDLANVFIEREDIYFTIQGHVCCTQYSRDAIDKKTQQRNLSLARAKYIYDYLEKKGIDKRRMKYVGMRRKFPLGGEAKFDRRVEILVTYVNKTRSKN
ncbi:MAG: OmpA family protein [Xanthomarina sp.]